MISLEHARACFCEMQDAEHSFTDSQSHIAIIQKHMDVYAKEVLAEDTKSKGTLIVENHRLKKANRELLKDKERLKEAVTTGLTIIHAQVPCVDTYWDAGINLMRRSLEALDKAALAKGESRGFVNIWERNNAKGGMKLKPCPFCGSSKITVEWEPLMRMDPTDTTRRWFAECTQCSCQGPFCQKEPEVIPAWNKRQCKS
jgi:Lar family restriction alleviation protein